MNLKAETLKRIKVAGKNPDEVLFVTDGCVYSSFEDFLKIADFEYDEGYGWVVINMDLQVVAKDWWLERHEYDGAEWWEFKTLPKRPATAGIPKVRHEQ